MGNKRAAGRKQLQRSDGGIYRLYRHFNAAGELLYVGVSVSALARLAQHREESIWFAEIARVEFEPFKTKEAVLEAEKNANQRERPRYNVAHNCAPEEVRAKDDPKSSRKQPTVRLAVHRSTSHPQTSLPHCIRTYRFGSTNRQTPLECDIS